MRQKCVSCKKELRDTSANTNRHPITGGICSACTKVLLTSSSSIDLTKFLDSLDSPVLLMQPDPRQVYATNQRALKLFGKDSPQVAGHRGGQVFDCIHAFTEAGCGKDVHCEGCKIKNTIVETFTTGKSFNGVSADLELRRKLKTTTYHLQVSTEQFGNMALMRIDRFDKKLDITKG